MCVYIKLPAQYRRVPLSNGRGTLALQAIEQE